MIDTDECATENTNECDANADCSNNEGSYSCNCIAGYYGDGYSCDGMCHDRHSLN